MVSWAHLSQHSKCEKVDGNHKKINKYYDTDKGNHCDYDYDNDCEDDDVMMTAEMVMWWK